MAVRSPRQAKKRAATQTRPQIEPLRIDSRNKLAWKGEERLELRPREFAVLCCLLEHAEELVTKATLYEAVWRAENVVVGDDALTTCIHEIRRALGEKIKEPRYIETRHKYGYRFIGPIAAAPLAESREEVASRQHSVVSREKIETRSSQLITENWQLTTPLVGREAELAQLHGWLEKALNGERQLVFVSGEAGIGKTTLVRAFLRQVAAASAAAIGQGQCIEHYGPGEAYLPVLEAIGRLCRDPRGAFLVEWMKQHLPTWLVQMPALLSPTEREELQYKVQGATRDHMLLEMSEGVELLTQQFPFVLVLEDVHWSDTSTLDLLASVARRQESARLFIIATYRPEEGLAEGHPLRARIQELQGHGLCQHLALTPLSETAVNEYIRQRFPASALPTRFPQLLHQLTDGNPLFLAAIVDDLIERGVIVQIDGAWGVQGDIDHLTAETPENIRQLLGKQIERLAPEERQVLQAASVVGFEFSTAAVAAAAEVPVAAAEERCAALAQRQHFVQPAGLNAWPDDTRSARYRFRHALYQHLWHEHVSIARRQQMCQRIAERLETAYGRRTDEVAAELAVYFEQGRDSMMRAVHYRTRAAEKAIQRCAYHEAVIHLKKGLDLLNTLPNTPERTQRELALHTTLGISLQAIRGYGNPESEQAYARAQKISQKVQEPAQLFRVLFGLWQFHLVRAEYQAARELGTQLLNLAESTHESGLLAEAQGAIGVTLFHLGETVSARAHLEQGTNLYNPDQPRTQAPTYSQDPWVACRSYSGQALWLLGYPDQALRRTQEAWRYAQALAHPFSQAFALHDVALLHQFHGNTPAVQQEAEMLLTLSREHGFPMWELAAMSLQGWAHAEQGQAGKAFDLMRQGASARRDIGMRLRIPYHQTRLAELYGKADQPAEGLARLEKAFALIEVTGERWWEAETYRIKGELLLQKKAKDQGRKTRFSGKE